MFQRITISPALHKQGSVSDGTFVLLGKTRSPVGISGLNRDELKSELEELKLVEESSSPSSISASISTSFVEDDEIFPDRYDKQPIGNSGKVAYTVFHGPSPGVYYNW